MAPFVNPYTFAPLGEVLRKVPCGHARLGEESLSGSFRVRFTARVPLLLGSEMASEPPRDAQRSVYVPGSSIAGSVRALHEALTASCLRIVDLDYVPVHRQAVTTNFTGGLEFAIIERVTEEGLPATVRVCDDVVWVHYRYLHECADVLTTGDSITVPTELRDSTQGRPRLTRPKDSKAIPPVVVKGGNHRILITDTLPRGLGNSWFPAGSPTDDVVLPVSRQARAELKLALEGAADLHGVSAPVAEVYAPMDPVSRRPAPGAVLVGRRWVVERRLPIGLPVWIRRVDGEVVEIRLSQAWRRVGRAPWVSGSRTRRPAPVHL